MTQGPQLSGATATEAAPVEDERSRLFTAVADDEIDAALASLLSSRDARQLAQFLAEDLEIPAQGYVKYNDATRAQLVDRLHQWFLRSPQRRADPKARSVVGVVVMTLCGLEESARLRTRPDPTDAPSGCDRCSQTLDDPVVQELLLDLYGQRDTLDHLKGNLVEHPKLYFHRHGSTSLILRTQRKNGENVIEAALKLVLLPFLRLTEIGEATRKYAKTYALMGSTAGAKDTSALMVVYASGDGWILSSFHPGETLAEWIARRDRDVRWLAHPISALRFRADAITDTAKQGGVNREPDLKWKAENQLFLKDMLTVSNAVLNGLAQYQDATPANPGLRPLAHGDLSPSNIIIDDDGSSCVLVDYGVNHLYRYLSSSGLEHDAVYVAPEVMARATWGESADYFSLAQIMIELLGLAPTSDRTVPDLLYVWHPSIARLLEDLLDPDPAFRGHLEADALRSTESIKNNVAFEVKIARDAAEAPDFKNHGLSRARFFFFPFSGELGRQRRIQTTLLEMMVARAPTFGERFHQWLQCQWDDLSRFAKSFGHSTVTDSEPYGKRRLNAARSSYRWSLISAVVLGLGFSVVLGYIALDFGVPMPVPYGIELALAQTPMGSLVQLLGLPPYTPNVRNWPARLVALTYALVAVKLYFNIYARLSPRIQIKEEVEFSRWSLLAALWMKALPAFNFVLVMLPTVVNPGLWPLATAIGQIGIAFGNLAVVQYLHRALNLEREDRAGVSAHPVSSARRANSPITGNDLISSWVTSSFVYAAVCLAVCVGIYTEKLVDVRLYACMVGFVNFFLFFVQKCGIDGPRIRVALTRAEIAAERVSLR